MSDTPEKLLAVAEVLFSEREPLTSDRDSYSTNSTAPIRSRTLMFRRQLQRQWFHRQQLESHGQR